MKRTWFHWLIGILLLVNLVLGIYNLTSIRKEAVKTHEREPLISSFSLDDESFYNTLSPDFSKKTVDGK